MTRSQIETNEENEATYCPEDDKLRLYVGRVPREEYEFLRAEGWTSTPKQTCDFVAVWTPAREATALQYAGFIGDEDTPPTERAADRAERFEGYREKRTGEALGHAERLDGSSLGFQSQAKADREERKLERIATKAGNQWEKAEYWQRRTAGVISHALHKSSPEVRMGRIKVIEAEIRKAEKSRAEYVAIRAAWLRCAEMTDKKAQDERAAKLAYIEHGDYTHPRTGRMSYLYDFARAEEGRESDPLTGAELCALYLAKHGELAPEGEWLTHNRLRLAYENQMLEAQGGRAAMVEMEAGGFIGKHQITKVTKSPATGRVVSVEIEYMSDTNKWGRPWSDGNGARMVKALINIEREGADIYRAPTDEERAAYAEKVKAEKKAKASAAKEKAAKGENCPLINPTDEDAEKLQALWNEEATKCGWYRSNSGKPSEVLRMTQATYSANSGGSFAKCSTVTVCEKGTKHERRAGEILTRHDVFKIRFASNGYNADRIIIITDKPQKPIPWAALAAAKAKCPTVESVLATYPALKAIFHGRDCYNWTDAEKQLVRDAQYCGLAFWSSMSQYGFTERGRDVEKAAQTSTEEGA